MTTMTPTPHLANRPAKPVLYADRKPAALLLLLLTADVFVLGGLTAMEIVRRLASAAITRQLATEAQGAILNLADSLIPYYAAFVAAATILVLATFITWGAWMRCHARPV